MQSLSWFKEHIGQTIYRDHSCDCKDCLRIDTEGLQVYDENHAEYLFNVQNDYASEGTLLNYRETLEIK